MNDKILGCLVGAAAGDAMGAATETKSIRQIMETYGGRVTTFQTPAEDVLARGRRAGQITDSFSILYYVLDEITKQNGVVTRQIGEDALSKWGESEYFEPFAGMTTRKVVQRLEGESKQTQWSYAGHLGNRLFKGHYYALSSNGAATKAIATGLINSGNQEKALQDAIELTISSHDDPYSISGACAVSVAISKALEPLTTVYDVVQAALYGAKEGENQARKRKDICVYPGPSVTKRMEMAIKMALHQGSTPDIAQELVQCIGSGPAISETVPIAIGLLIKNEKHPMEALFDAVNVGDETSAIACLTGSMIGALYGVALFPEEYLKVLEENNPIHLSEMAGKL